MSSTGKRRYGHPALTGVLPHPWLPLKKGETLINSRTGATSNGNGTKSDQAVVLTLRKRQSIVRKRVQSIAAGGPNRQSSAPTQLQTGDLLGLADGGQQQQTSAGDGSSGSAGVAVDVPHEDPWRDARPGPARRVNTAPSAVHHRLSFDYGSGVIVLPDDGDWLEELEDEDSEEEDYGVGGGSPAITRGPSSGGGGGGPSTPRPPLSATASEGADVASSAASASESHDPSSSPSRLRYGTYYHHPERRRQTIPGAFPRLAS